MRRTSLESRPGGSSLTAESAGLLAALCAGASEGDPEAFPATECAETIYDGGWDGMGLPRAGRRCLALARSPTNDIPMCIRL